MIRLLSPALPLTEGLSAQLLLLPTGALPEAEQDHPAPRPLGTEARERKERAARGRARVRAQAWSLLRPPSPAQKPPGWGQWLRPVWLPSQ